jgi:hypothetical protein
MLRSHNCQRCQEGLLRSPEFPHRIAILQSFGFRTGSTTELCPCGNRTILPTLPGSQDCWAAMHKVGGNQPPVVYDFVVKCVDAELHAKGLEQIDQMVILGWFSQVATTKAIYKHIDGERV